MLRCDYCLGHRAAGLARDCKHGRGLEEPGQQRPLLVRGPERGHAHLVLPLRREDGLQTRRGAAEAGAATHQLAQREF